MKDLKMQYRTVIMIAVLFVFGSIQGWAATDVTTRVESDGLGNVATAASSAATGGKATATNGNVTDNSKTTNTNTAVGGTVTRSGNATNNGNNNGHNGNGNGSGNTTSPSNSTTDNSGSGDKAYAVAYPSVTGTVGNSTSNEGSIFGNLTISDTESFKVIQEMVQTVNAEIAGGAIDKATGQQIIVALDIKLLKSLKTKRVAGILWETSGKNLFNLFGVLTTDSALKDGPAQGDLSELIAQLTQSLAATTVLNNTEKNPSQYAIVVPSQVSARSGNGGDFPAGVQK